MNQQRSLFRDPWVAVLLLGALATRLIGLPGRTLWFDEAYSVALSQQPLGNIWRLTALDVHPPLYYWLLHGWMLVFGDSLWAIRGLSVAAAMGAVVAAAIWLQTLASRRAVYFALILLALQPIAVRYSQEARMYTLLTLWLMAASLVLALWRRQPLRRRYPLHYALLAAAALYTHYFALLGLCSHWLWLCLDCEGRSFIRSHRWWLANLGALALFAPWLPPFFHQLTHTGGIYWIPPLSGAAVTAGLWEFVWAGRQPLRQWPLLGAVVPLILAWAVWQVRGPRRSDASQIRGVMLLGLLPIALACFLSLIKPVFVTRYLSFTALPLTLVLALAIDRLTLTHGWRGRWLLVAVCGLQIGGLVNGYRAGDQLNGPDGDHNRTGQLASEVNRMWQQGDEAVSDDGYYLSWRYYLREHTQPWLWLNGPLPLDSGSQAVLFRWPQAPWLRDFAQLPVGTCGVWVFTSIGQARSLPPDSQWSPVLQRQAGDAVLHYYARRSCLAVRAEGP